MAITKYNSQSLLQRQDQLSRKKAYRDSLILLKDGRDGIFWKTLKQQLEAIAEGSSIKVELELAHDSCNPAAELANCKYHQGARQCASEIISSVDNVEQLLDKEMESIAKLEAELKNIKEAENVQED